jgi:ribosomal protein S18 acetylase RimI-like enzyme
MKSQDVHMLLVPTPLSTELPSAWKRNGGVTFMVMGNQPSGPSQANSGVRVVSGNRNQIVDDFSTAQCAGFLETPDARAGWASWLTQANLNNLDQSDVTFYVAYVSNSPVSGAIAVNSDSCVGIYGVATDPKYRKRGLGTLLLNEILTTSKASDVIGLQVETDSYAHSYYKRLGFKDIYELGRFKNEN